MQTRRHLSFCSFLVRPALACAAAWLLSQCASPKAAQVAAAPAAARASYMDGAAGPRKFVNQGGASTTPLESRPGLGSKLGHEIYDASTVAAFYRKAGGLPDAVATFHYNDEEGARLMAEVVGPASKHRGAFELIPGRLKLSVESRYGDSAFEYYRADGHFFVVGTPGSSYELKLENLTKDPLEVVVSIDGLDILDGLPASVRKPGYMIGSKKTITISGMRVGGKLRSLEFSTVAEARAATAFGERGARNVGVVGVACYVEDASERRRVRVEEGYLRGGARAFGGQD